MIFPIEISSHTHDQVGKSLKEMPTEYPARIVSLVPSLTEFLVDIGVGDRLVGRTKFCIHPKDAVVHIPTFGGTKNPKVDAIVAAGADLVIMNREENRLEDYEMLAERTKVLMTDILTIDDALREMHRIGEAVGCVAKANSICNTIEGLIPQHDGFQNVRVAYFIWREPWMVAGGKTYIDDVLATFGLENIFGDLERYPTVQLADLDGTKPDIVLLSSEPYPFKDKHLAEILNILPDAWVELVDGEWFSWYGSRMLEGFKSIGNWRKNIS